MLGTRLKTLRSEKGVSQKQLAAAMGVTQQAVGKWEMGKSAPDPEMLRRLAEFFATSTDSILGYSAAVPANRFSAPPVQYTAKQEHPIPVIGTVRAGWGSLAFEDDYGTETASVKDPENYFYLVVKGNSMAPRIQNGDLALVRKQNTLENGELGIIIVGEGEGTLKKFIKNGNTIVLQPFNPEYQPMVLKPEDMQFMCIAGKVVETKTKW